MSRTLALKEVSVVVLEQLERFSVSDYTAASSSVDVRPPQGTFVLDRLWFEFQ